MKTILLAALSASLVCCGGPKKEIPQENKEAAHKFLLELLTNEQTLRGGDVYYFRSQAYSIVLEIYGEYPKKQ